MKLWIKPSSKIFLSILAIVLLSSCQTSTKKIDKQIGSTSNASSTELETDPAETNQEIEETIKTALMAGEFALQDGRMESAAKHYAKAANLSTDAKVITHALQVMFSAKKWDLAAPVLERAASLPEMSALTIAQGRAALALASNEKTRAIEALSKLLKIEPRDESRKMFAPALVMSEDKVLAQAVFEALMKMQAFGRELESLTFASRVAEQMHDAKNAKILADQAIEFYPNAAEGYRSRAEMLYREKKFDAALLDFSRAVAKEPNNPELILVYAASLDAQDRTLEAIEILIKGPQTDATLTSRAAYAAKLGDTNLQQGAYAAIKALPDPKTEPRLELLGQMAEVLEDKEAALAWYQGIGKGERYVNAQLRIAILQDALGNFDAAKRTLEKVREDGIEDIDELRNSYLIESEIFKRRKQPQDSIAALERGLSVLHDDRDLLYTRSIERIDNAQLDLGIADLRRLVELNPNDADLINALGYTLTDRTDQHQEALQLIERALAAKPGDGAILDSLGWAKFHLGDLDGAISALREAWSKQSDAEVAGHLAEVLLKKGDRSGALNALELGEMKHPKSEVLLKVRKRLGL